MPQVTRLDWIARLGYFARAVVYMMLGYIALSTASKAADGQSAVFDRLRELPGGTAWLLLIGVGLLAYGLFRLATAFPHPARLHRIPVHLAGQAVGRRRPEVARGGGHAPRPATRIAPAGHGRGVLPDHRRIAGHESL
jgi:hypothetical protein